MWATPVGWTPEKIRFLVFSAAIAWFSLAGGVTGYCSRAAASPRRFVSDVPFDDRHPEA